MAKIDSIPMKCPECGGGVWNNTTKPKRNPKQPDAACKERDNCGWAGWLPDGAKSGGKGSPTPRVAYTWDELGKAYLRCRQIAERVWKGSPVASDPTALAAVTATLWIAAKDQDLKVESEPTP